jgi:autotransporter translocation and assembly factor TamB
MRILKSAARITLVFLIGGVSCVYFLGYTTPGLKISLNALALFSQGQLHIGYAKGKLLSGFTLREVNYHNAKVELTINSLKLKWSLKSLPHRLVINQLQTEDFTLKLHACAPDSEFDFKQLAILKSLTIQQLLVENFTYIPPDQSAFKFAEINLQKTTSNNAIIFAKTLGGELNGNITLLFGKDTQWSLVLTGEHINPGLQWAAWPGDITFALKSQGNIDNNPNGPDLMFQLENLSGMLRESPLQGHINLTLKNHQFVIKEGELANGKAHISFNGAVTDVWNINWNIQLPDLAQVVPQSQGSFTSQGALRGPRATPSLTADFQATEIALAQQKIKRLDGKINFSTKPEVPFALLLNGYGIKIQKHNLAKIDLGITGQTRHTGQQWITALAVAIAQTPYIQAQFSVPDTINSSNYSTVPLLGQIGIHFPDLAMLQSYLPMVNHLRGTLLGKLSVSGTLKKPDFNGELTLNNATVGIPKLGIDFKNITLRFVADKTKQASYKGSFQLGDGSGQLQGSTNFNSPDYATELKLHGTNLLIVNLIDYKIHANPDLNLHFYQFKVAIDGNLAIPDAKITPKDFRQTVTLPEEIVFIGGNSAKPAAVSASTALAAMPNMQIAVQLQNHILLRYQDLKTTLGGALTIHAGPNSPATAVGSLFTIGGTYHAYGQQLTIQVGRLTYTGGLLTNPGLNIKASREISTPNTMANSATSLTQTYVGSGTLTAGIQISGTLNKPSITLYSVPAGLSQDDILSYLVLGIPRSQASIKDSLAILNATSAVGLGGNGASQLASITKKLQNGLGLTEMNVQSVQTFDPNAGSTVGTTSLVLGKALSKKLYVHYSVSLFSSTPVSVFNLRYKFNKHWSVQTETSTIDNGADLLYTIEQN